MFCTKCGNEIADGEAFCGLCGTPVYNLADHTNAPGADPSQGVVLKPKKVGFILPTLITTVVLTFAGLGIYGAIQIRNLERDARIAEENRNLWNELRDSLRLGDRYLDELDYESAIAAYERAIEIDPRNIDAYWGLAESYVGIGDYERAIDILTQGEDETDNDEFSDFREELENVWNILASLEGIVVVADEDTDYSNNQPLSGARIHLERNGDGFSADSTSDSDGYYHFSDLHLGEYDMTINADGYTSFTQHLYIYEMQTDAYNATTEMIPSSMAGNGTASGYIYDALEGYGIDGLTLNIRSGANNLTSGVIASVTTGMNGYYQTPELPAGLYSIEIVDNRGYYDHYIDGLINVKILGSSNIDNQNGTVSTQLLTGQIRIVLSWGSYPDDLDSHLFARIDGGRTYHTWYAEMGAYDYDYHTCYAALDLDDVSSYGPETTTIYVQEEGDYTFIVHDFSRYSYQDIAQSGAVVQVYMGNSSMPNYTFYAPRGDGLYWEVFSYNGKTEQVTAINHLSNDLDYSYADIDLDYYYENW